MYCKVLWIFKISLVCISMANCEMKFYCAMKVKAHLVYFIQKLHLMIQANYTMHIW